jgi:mannose-1-phosphate guanylyltransferase/mannose-6-phosphate isomerase
VENLYVVILSGGSGTRLWPLSRKNKPKQLLPFIDDKSLLESTVDRVSNLCNKEHTCIITTKEQLTLIPQKICNKIGLILKEPTGRNTGPAILYSCLEIAKKNKNAMVVFLPADHFIPDVKKYCSYMQKAIDFAYIKNNIITLGLMPTYPATGYGYIQANTEKIIAGKTYPVSKFHEKPNLKTAEKYFKQKDMFWNLGMFVGKASLFINEYKTHATEIYSCVQSFINTDIGYELAPSTSIDYAIMEKSKNISVIPCDFEWNDVGNLHIFLSIQQRYKKPITEIINIDCKNNIAKTNKRVVSFIGLNNVCVVEDEDVLIIAKKDDIEKINKIRDNVVIKSLL